MRPSIDLLYNIEQIIDPSRLTKALAQFGYSIRIERVFPKHEALTGDFIVAGKVTKPGSNVTKRTYKQS
jgi:hypothetical protein|tara:strand:- start:167 stop:373 length:207 start_codon:yes stop_codon:yes gene_type:complete